MTATMAAPTDSELVPGLAARDEEAVRCFVERYWVRARRSGVPERARISRSGR